MLHFVPSLLAIITSVDGLRDALRNNAPSKNYYAVTGTVTATIRDLNCILTDGKDFCYVRAPTNGPCVQVGDIVWAKGRIAGESHGGRVPYSKRMTVIGQSKALPPVLDVSSDLIEKPEYEYRTVRTTGHVVDIADDDIDPSNRPGPPEGHFGLQGIRERVKQHLTEVFEKLGAANRAEVAAIALRKHLLKA